ncbi:hypothetical protein N8731_00440 [Pelagibacteraceae bacterium]|nr:hypothetical protein [Pelagibacteraceae bacterium]
MSEDLKISEKQLIRLSNYLDGELYSFELKRNVFAYPMAFIISENGDKSIVLACEGIINECDNSVHIYQLIKRYEKKLNQDVKILALNKKVLSQKIKANVDEIKSKKIVKYDENIFYDLILVPAEDCGGDDC